MLLFAISEEYLNINWKSSTNEIRTVNRTGESLFCHFPHTPAKMLCDIYPHLNLIVQHAVTSTVTEICQTPFLSRVESGS